MIIASSIEELELTSPVITMGFFDGVHAGHAHILRAVVRRAHQSNVPSLVVTYWPHPRLVLGHPQGNLMLLNSLEEKKELISRIGVDALLVLEFNQDLSIISARDFVEQIIAKGLKTSHVVVGQKHFFGYNGSGNYALLQEMGETLGFTTELTPTIEVDGVEVRSSLIRKALLAGDLARASSMLNHPYSITGTVVGGMKLGSSIGFPTANVAVPDENKLVPPNGVYAVWAHVAGDKYPAMLNIGVKPTVASDLKKSIEAHIIDFSKDIYNLPIRLDFIERIRDEVKFPSINDLKAQLHTDRKEALAILGGA